MSLPLTNKKVLVTREESQAKQFSEFLLIRGAVPIEVPLLKIDCISVKEQLSKINFQQVE